MSDDNGMVTLNIYNNPPIQSVNETTSKINQTEQDLNLNTDKPQPNPIFYDNVRNENPQNYNSAPRNNNNRNMQNSIDESSDTTEENQKNIAPVAPVIPVAPVVQKPPLYPQFQQPIYQQIPRQPMIVANPAMIPYNQPYGQPIIMQGNYANPNTKIKNNNNRTVNNAPKTIIIRERKKPKSHAGEDCCTAFLAGCGACLAFMCLMGLCCPHSHRGRW